MYSELYPGSISDSNITENKIDIISWITEEHEIMSDEGFFKQIMSEKQSSFRKLKKLLILNAPTTIHVKKFTGCASYWSILNNDWPILKKLLTNINICRALCYSQILNPYISRLVKEWNLWQKFNFLCLFAACLNLSGRL